MLATTGRIPGLYILDNFISEAEEDAIVKALDQRDWIKMLQRRVQHFGYEFVYGANNVDKTKKISDMPDFLQFLLPRVNEYLKNFALTENLAQYKPYTSGQAEKTAFDAYVDESGFTFDQLTVNDYQPGQGIPPHVDTHSPFEEIFVCLSLKSGVSMNFRSPDGLAQ